MSVVAAIRSLLAQGFSVEQALTAAEAFESASAPERTARQDRNARYYAKRKASEERLNASYKTTSDGSVLNKTPSRGDARGEINSSNKKISGEGRKEESAPAARPVLDGFKAELSSILDPERIEALVAVRRKKGATMTPHAGRLLAKALSACPNVAEAADEMVLRNWTGVKPEWLERQRSTATAPPPFVKPNGLMAAYGRSQERERNGREDSGGGADVERVPVDNRQLRLIAGHISAAARGPID